MYLLNRIKYRIIPCGQPRFTFHYVSIKSTDAPGSLSQHRHLHSTMYLLNRAGIWGTVQRAWFTFHYVSIKSFQLLYPIRNHSDLHSTMYLLNLFSKLFKTITVDKFTFHYVSIKSRWTLSAKYTLKSFTFHYVSIKSKIINAVAHEVIRFTFHYVSIKSSSLPVLLFLFRNLHSTIYLS